MFKGFRDFIAQGNVIDLAVAVVIGAAFTAVVTALVAGIFTPIIGALFNANDLQNALVVAIPTASGGSAKILFGSVIAAIINFLIIALVVYFVFVLPINKLKERMAALREAGVVEETVAGPTDLDLLTEIRDLLAHPTATGINTTDPTGTTASIDGDGGRHAGA